MLDLWFAGGQAASLLGLGYGAWLAFTADIAPRKRPQGAHAGSGFLASGAP